MNDLTAEDVLKKTFEHLEEVLEKQNHKNQKATGDRLNEVESGRNKEEEEVSEKAQDEI